MLFDYLKDIEKIDQWLDAKTSPEYRDMALAQDWARVAKLSEEVGEAVSALIGTTGQNPRKGYYAGMEELLSELADCAWTAVTAIQHFTKDRTLTGKVLADRLQELARRANAQPKNGYHHP